MCILIAKINIFFLFSFCFVFCFGRRCDHAVATDSIRNYSMKDPPKILKMEAESLTFPFFMASILSFKTILLCISRIA